MIVLVVVVVSAYKLIMRGGLDRGHLKVPVNSIQSFAHLEKSTFIG